MNINTHALWVGENTILRVLFNCHTTVRSVGLSLPLLSITEYINMPSECTC